MLTYDPMNLVGLSSLLARFAIAFASVMLLIERLCDLS